MLRKQPQRNGPSNCLAKTQVYAKPKGEVYGLTPAPVSYTHLLYEAGYPRVTHPSAAQSQSSSSEESKQSASLDLHVLGTPPAFILSQDQTLVKSVCLGQESLLAILSLFTVLVCFQTVLKNFSL